MLTVSACMHSTRARAKASTETADLKQWKTVAQIKEMYHCSLAEAEAMVKGKPSMPNPDWLDNPKFTLYNMFGGKSEQHIAKEVSITEATWEGEVSEEQAPHVPGIIANLSDTDSSRPMKKMNTNPKTSPRSSAKAAEEKQKPKQNAQNHKQCKQWVQSLGDEARACEAAACDVGFLVLQGKAHLAGQKDVLTSHATTLRRVRDAMESAWANGDWKTAKEVMSER